jgi:hypothetical protein
MEGEGSGNWFRRAFNKLGVRKDIKKDRDPKEEERELRQELIEVQQAASKFANSSRSGHAMEEGKPFLSDMIILPKVGNKYDLVSNAHLRAEELWGSGDRVFPEAEDQLAIDQYIQNSDTVSIPRKLLKNGSYITLFIPSYSAVKNYDTQDERTGNTGYDITVLYCKDEKTLLKLMSNRELNFREHHIQVDAIHTQPEFKRDFKADPLPHPKREADSYPEVETITLKDEQETINIWSGNEARQGVYGTNPGSEIDQLKSHYQMTVNGSACYRLESGSVQPNKITQLQPSSVTQTSTQPIGA